MPNTSATYLNTWSVTWMQLSKRAIRTFFTPYYQHIPEHVFKNWKSEGPTEFPNINTSTQAWCLSVAGLMQYFGCVRREKNTTLLPSRAADAVWHAWLRADPEGLVRFQKKFFGRAMPHVEKEAMALKGDTSAQAMTRTWYWACKTQGLNPLESKKPLVFELDSNVDMPLGWSYGYDKNTRTVQCTYLNVNGSPTSKTVALGITAALMVHMGLVQAHELQAYHDMLERSKQDAGSSGGCGVGYGNATDASGNCSDSDGGSSCGGGCGGD